jgi:hypothetical protein
MTQLADFTVINSDPVAIDGQWRSSHFESGGRLIRKANGVEQDNAYLVLTMTSPQGGQDVAVRIIVNAHPLSSLMEIKVDSQRTAMAAFPASFLRDGNDNTLELHSRGEKSFILLHAVCQFRQDS